MDKKVNSLLTFLKKQVTLFHFFTLLLFPLLIVRGDKLSLPVGAIMYITLLQATDVFHPLYRFSWEFFLFEAYVVIATLGISFLSIYLFVKPRTRIGDRLAIGSILALYPPFLWTVVCAIQYPKTMAFVLDVAFFLLSFITLYGLVSRLKEY